jgi:Xaa-Pro aminopeptidase
MVEREISSTYRCKQPILQRIRSVKESEELDYNKHVPLPKKIHSVKPNVMEYEIEAEFIHEFTRNRSKGFAYTPIIGSGNNANVLHYIENNQQKSGDLILIDAGAEYANYSSDMTVLFRFRKIHKKSRLRRLRVKNEATKMLVPGTLWKQYHIEVGKLMTSELLT